MLGIETENLDSAPGFDTIHTLASIDLSIEGSDANLVRFEAHEALGGLFHYTADVIFETKGGTVELATALGKTATITVKQREMAIRYFHGVIVSVEYTDLTVAGEHAQLTLSPRLELFAHDKNYQLFEEMTAPDIISSVLTECKVDFRKKLSGTYRKRGYTTQFAESHFAFVSRLMEEEGIYYYFEHEDGKHTIVLCDAPSSHSKGTPAVLEYNPTARNLNIGNGDRTSDNFIHTWHQRISSQGQKKVVIWDNLFSMPGNALEQSSTLLALDVGNTKPQQAEVYDFGGTYELHQPASGGEDAAEGQVHIDFSKARVKLRREILEARRRIHGAVALSPTLACGNTFKLENQPTGMASVNEYLMINVRTVVYGPAFESGHGMPSDNVTEMEVIPATHVWRSQAVTPRPVAHGPQTAIVVGPKGEEIFTDKYGRVKVQFPWDRKGVKDAHSSAWLRVSQTGGLGNINMPRIGHEVLVGFLEGNPDRPIVIGRLFNADQMPSYVLPDHKTRTVWRSKTFGVPAGKSAKEELKDDSKPLSDVADTDGNELRFEDKYGKEEVLMLAHRDMNTRIRFNETHHVGRNQEVKILLDATRHVERDQTVDILRHSKVTIGEDSTIETKGNEKRKVTGTSDVTITGNHKVLMEGEASYTTNGKNTIKVDGDDKQDYGGKSDIKVTGALTIESSAKILLKVGGNSVEISPTGIKINGTMVKIEGTATAEVASAMTTVKASGVLTAQGTLVKIN